jgi:hypothetical protein
MNERERAVDREDLPGFRVRRVGIIGHIRTTDDVSHPDGILDNEGLIQTELFAQLIADFFRSAELTARESISRLDPDDEEGDKRDDQQDRDHI